MGLADLQSRDSDSVASRRSDSDGLADYTADDRDVIGFNIRRPVDANEDV